MISNVSLETDKLTDNNRISLESTTLSGNLKIIQIKLPPSSCDSTRKIAVLQ